MCCTSLRGAAYFGASIHITLGAVLFIRYVIVTGILTFFNITDVSVIKDRITGYLLPFVAYITLFLAFGIVIFHSVEKEYFMILKWATLGFSLLQILILVALYVLRFHPTYEYRQFPFLPVSITDGYVHSGFQTTEGRVHSGGPNLQDHPSEEGYSSSEFLPKLTRREGGAYPTSATGGSRSSRQYGSPSGKSSSVELLGGLDGRDVLELDPVPTAPPNKWLAEIYSVVALIVMTVVSIVYLILLLIYVRQLIYEDSGHVFGHAQSVTRNVAFYVQPQFAQSGNSDNKLTNSPAPTLRNQAVHGMQQANCTQAISNTQIPNEFLPQPQNHQQQPQLGNHLKPGNNVGPNATPHKNVANQQHPQQATPQSHQNQNHVTGRSPVPPAREMQQNIQNQQQQQVITIYPQKGGGYTSSSSSPRMQVKFAKPLEQHLEPGGVLSQTHIHGRELPPEPPRSCLVNSVGTSQQQQQGNNQQQPQPNDAHMVPPPLPQRLNSSGRNTLPFQGRGQYQSQLMHDQSQMGNVPPPIPHRQHSFPGQHSFQPATSSNLLGQSAPASYTHQQQHMPYQGKSRAQQQSYSDMVDNSSYLVFSGNPNTSNERQLPTPPLHPSHLASTSHTYPHCSQRRPSGSMV